MSCSFPFFVPQSSISSVKLASMNSKLRRPRAATICRPSLLSPSTSFPSSNVHSDSLVANGIFMLHWPSDARAQQRGAGEWWRGGGQQRGMSKLQRKGCWSARGKDMAGPAAEFPPPANLCVLDTQFRSEVMLEKRVPIQEKHEKEVAG